MNNFSQWLFVRQPPGAPRHPILWVRFISISPAGGAVHLLRLPHPAREAALLAGCCCWIFRSIFHQEVFTVDRIALFIPSTYPGHHESDSIFI